MTNGPNVDAQSCRPAHNPFGAGLGQRKITGGELQRAVLGGLAAQHVLIAANQQQADH